MQNMINNRNQKRDPIIFFDGICNLCNVLIRFIIRHDKRAVFRFGPLQSQEAKKLLETYGSFANQLSTIVLLEDNRIYTESDAILEIARQLRSGLQIFYVLILVPNFIRDIGYRFISRNRYRIFGRLQACIVTNPQLIDRFL